MSETDPNNLDSDAAPAKKSGLLGKVLPWLITILCFAYLYNRIAKLPLDKPATFVIRRGRVTGPVSVQPEPLGRTLGRESLVETGSFRYVLAAADTPAPNRETESLHYRRIHVGFNVTDVELLREEREWNDA
mgnify:CR=1 FL=1